MPHYAALLLTAATASLILTGCHKPEEGPTTASGKVVDTVTNQPVPGARVYLLRSARGGSALSGSAPKPASYVTADAQGNYSYSFEADEDALYDLQGAAPGYMSGWLESQPTVGIRGGRKNKTNVELRPEGYLRVRFVSPASAPYSRVDYMLYNGRVASIVADASGHAIDTTIVDVLYGGQSTTLSWWVSPDGTRNNFHQGGTVYCPAHDTADFVIRF